MLVLLLTMSPRPLWYPRVPSYIPNNGVEHEQRFYRHPRHGGVRSTYPRRRVPRAAATGHLAKGVAVVTRGRG